MRGRASRETTRSATEATRSRQALTREVEISSALSELSKRLLGTVGLDEICDLILEFARRLTSSSVGFVGHIDRTTGHLVSSTLSRDVWAACQIPHKSVVFEHFRGLWGWVLLNHTPLLSNDPASDPRSQGVPGGHLAIRRFLAVPVMREGALLGEIAVANGASDYVPEDVAVLERLAVVYSLALEKSAAEREREDLLRALRERVKELDCLSRVTEAVRADIDLREVLQRVARVLPSGSPHPERTRARLSLDGEEFVSGPDLASSCALSSDILVGGVPRGIVEVSGAPANSKEVFQDEQRELLTNVARLLGESIERRLSLDALRCSRDFAWRLLQEFPALIWRAGVDGRCDYFNEAWLDFTGRRLDQEMGDGWAEGVHPEDLERCLHIYREAFAARKPFSMEYRLRHRSGEYRWIEDHGRSFLDPHGRFAGYVGSCYDITERKRAEQVLLNAHWALERKVGERTAELRAAHDRLEVELAERQRAEAETRRLAAAVEQSTQAVMVTDTAGALQYVNPAFTTIYGYSREEALGQTPRLLKSGVQDDAFYLDLWTTITADRPWRGRFANRRKDGSLVDVEATITSIRSDTGRITGFVSVELDVTEQLALTRRVEEQGKLAMIGSVAAGIAHEVKNPLFALSSGIQLLREELVLAPEQARTFDIMLESVMRMDRLIGELRMFTARPSTDRRPTAPAVLVSETLDLNRGLLARKRLRVRSSFEPALPEVAVDPDQIRQVLLNLLQNAIAASPEAGTIEVSVRRERGGRRVLVRMADQGPGVPDELVERIFDPFYTTKPGSTGLGLAVCRKIVADHEGVLRLERTPGPGAAFVVELPAGAVG